MQNLKAKKDNNTSKEATRQKVYTFGLRNEIPLTEEQKNKHYLMRLMIVECRKKILFLMMI
jgi:hypothetical protein